MHWKFRLSTVIQHASVFQFAAQLIDRLHSATVGQPSQPEVPTLERRPNDVCQETENEEISQITGRNKKRRRLQFLFGYQATLHHRSDSDSAEDQLARYIELINREDLEVDDQFDACFRPEFDKLWPLFSRLWCVPATSAPVERIFSQSGIIMRPHRAKMSDELLETIMFLKCNN